MPLFIKKSGTQRSASLWYKVGGVWKTADRQNPLNFRVFFKHGGVWQEVWPRLPGPVRSPAVSQDYGATAADQISWVFTWLAPIVGWAVANYKVTVFTVDGAGNPLSTIGTYTTTTPSLALTNQAAYAGQRISFTVTAQSAYGAGPDVRGGIFVGINYPAPPTPTLSSISLNNGTTAVTYSTVTGNRVTAVVITISDEFGRSKSVNVGAGAGIATGTQPWVGGFADGHSFQGFNFTATVFVYGPGGSASASLNAQYPSVPYIGAGGYRFLHGVINGNYDMGNYASSVIAYAYDLYSATIANTIGLDPNPPFQQNFNISGSYTDYHVYEVWLQAANAWGTSATVYVTRDLAYGYPSGDSFTGAQFMKIPNPFYVTAQDSNTYQWAAGAGPYTINDPNYIFQGYGGASLMDVGYVYYGNSFANLLGPYGLGYGISVASADILIGRGSGGNPGGVSPVIHPHTAQSVYDGAVYILGDTYVQPSMIQGTAAWEPMPNWWISYMMSETNGWHGLGFYDPSTTINPSTGVTDSWFRFYRETNSTGGIPYLTVRVFHDG